MKTNLSKYQGIFSLVITFFILVTWMFEQVVVMWRVISFSLLLGFLKRVKSVEEIFESVHAYSQMNENEQYQFNSM